MKLDEFTIGQTYSTKRLKITKTDIIRFATEFDPEYMHLDENMASGGRFGGIIASGMHTLSVTFKLWVEERVWGDDVICGKSWSNVKYIKPVYPDDVLHVIAQVVGVEPKDDDTGTLTLQFSTYNQNDEKVLQSELAVLMKR